MAYIYDIADTWNASGTTFTAIKMNVTDTTSAAASLLMDLQVGGVSRFRVDKAGVVRGPLNFDIVSGSGNENGGVSIFARTGALQNGINCSYNDQSIAFYVNSSTPKAKLAANRLAFQSSVSLQWAAASDINILDLAIHRDAANTLAQRNGVNAQAFNLYNSYTDASNYERGFMRFVSNVLEIGTDAAGTGSSRSVSLKTASGRYLTLSHTTTLDSNAVYTRFFSGSTVIANINLDTQQIAVGSGGSFTFSSGADSFSTSADTGIARAAAGVLRINNASTGGGAMQLTEMTAPAAPATNNVRIYAEDDGAGKTRLMALFASGVAQQIAIEP